MKSLKDSDDGVWRNYGVPGPCPSFRILDTIRHNASETGTLSVLRWGKETPAFLGPLQRSNLNHQSIRAINIGYRSKHLLSESVQGMKQENLQ
jgi:hypothetical protein